MTVLGSISMPTVKRDRYRTAAYRVQQLYPGPVGVICADHINTWLEFGFRLDRIALTDQLVEFIMAQPFEGNQNARI